MNAEKPTGEFDHVQRAEEYLSLLFENRASHLAARNHPLKQNLRIVSAGLADGWEEIFRALHAIHAEGRARTRGLDEHGIADVLRHHCIMRVKDEEFRSLHACAARREIRQRLVHAHGRGRHPAAYIGDARKLQQPLHRAVFSKFSVQHRQHHIQTDLPIPKTNPVYRPVGRKRGRGQFPPRPARPPAANARRAQYGETRAGIFRRPAPAPLPGRI